MTKNDLFSNFFAQKEDIDTNSRADITQRGLMEINNFAIVMIFKGELSNDFSILNEYNLVIITEIISLETAQTLNQYCRMKHIGFIYTCEFGLSSFLFTDFGDDFIDTLAKEYWGIEETELIYAEKLDIEGIDVDEIIDYTCDEIRRSFE